jgi:hypothetical protein
MSKVQDGNGSSRDDGYRDNSKTPPPAPTDITVNKPFEDEPLNEDLPSGSPEDPHSKSRGIDRLDKFKDDMNWPVDANAADVKRLMNEWLAKMNKGLRT